MSKALITTNGKKYVDLIPEISWQYRDYSQLLDWRSTKYLLVLKYRRKCLKHLKNWVV